MDSVHTRINENTPTEKSVGVNLCFLHIKFRLSVGAFFERPRANTVRPYRVLGKYFMISPLILHTLGAAFLFQMKNLQQAITLISESFSLSAIFHCVLRDAFQSFD